MCSDDEFGGSSNKGYWKSLSKRKEAERKRKEQEWAENRREELRRGFIEEIYGVVLPKDDTDGYKSNTVISGKSHSSEVQRLSGDSGDKSLGKGYGQKGNRGGYQDTRYQFSGQRVLNKTGTSNLKRR